MYMSSVFNVILISIHLGTMFIYGGANIIQLIRIHLIANRLISQHYGLQLLNCISAFWWKVNISKVNFESELFGMSKLEIGNFWHLARTAEEKFHLNKKDENRAIFTMHWKRNVYFWSSSERISSFFAHLFWNEVIEGSCL